MAPNNIMACGSIKNQKEWLFFGTGLALFLLMSSAPIKTTLVFYLSVFIVIFSSPLAMAAASVCINFWSVETYKVGEDPFKNSDRIEESLSLLIGDINFRFGNNQTLNARLEQALQKVNDEVTALSNLQERLLKGEAISPVEFQSFHTRISKIREILTETTRPMETLPTTAKTQDLELNDLIIEPSRVETEKPYRVELASGESISVIISDSIAREVFKNPQRQRVVSRSLRKISLGIFGFRYTGDGVIRMFIDPSAIEIRSSGKDGNFRLFGYLENENLHLVHYTMSSDHSGPITLKNSEYVLSLKRARGH